MYWQGRKQRGYSLKLEKGYLPQPHSVLSTNEPGARLPTGVIVGAGVIVDAGVEPAGASVAENCCGVNAASDPSRLRF